MDSLNQRANTVKPDELPAGWILLRDRIRQRISAVQYPRTDLARQNQLDLLEADIHEICGRFETLYREAHRLLDKYETTISEQSDTEIDTDSLKVQSAAIQIQREEHEQSAGPMEILKALLLWRDTPDERVEEGS